MTFQKGQFLENHIFKGFFYYYFSWKVVHSFTKPNAKPKDTHMSHEKNDFWERRMEGKYLRNLLPGLEGMDCRIPEKSEAWQLTPGIQLE